MLNKVLKILKIIADENEIMPISVSTRLENIKY